MEHSVYAKEYADFLLSQVHTKKPISIVCDVGNGATAVVLSILRELLAAVCTIHLLNETIDPDFPGRGPNPTDEGALNPLSAAVQKEKAHFGVAFDGDGDRAVFVDDRGNEIPSHVLLALLVTNVPPPYVADELTYQAILHSIPELSSQVFASRVGRKFIPEAMTTHNASVGGEISGHYYFRDFWSLDSGLLTLMYVISAVSELAEPLSQKIAAYQPHHTKLIIAHTPKTWPEAEGVVRAQMLADGASAEHLRTIDGLTADFGEAWVNLRPSNTEPVIKITAGAAEMTSVEEILARYDAILR